MAYLLSLVTVKLSWSSFYRQWDNI